MVTGRQAKAKAELSFHSFCRSLTGVYFRAVYFFLFQNYQTTSQKLRGKPIASDRTQKVLSWKETLFCQSR